MSQHDMNIANQGFPAFRADLNNALGALATTSAGATEPSTTFANQFWYDSTGNLLKMRNSDNDAWIILAYFDQTADEWEVRSAVIQAVDAGGVQIKTDEGTTRINIQDDGDVSIDSGTLFVDSGNSRVGIGTSTPSEIFHVNSGIDNDCALFESTDNIATITIADDSGSVQVRSRDSGEMAFHIGGDASVAGTSSTEAMRIDSSGNVGIGTSSPQAALEISTATANKNLILTNSGAPTTGTRMSLDIAENAGCTIDATDDAGGGNTLIFSTGGSEVMRIDSDGGVLVNTATNVSTGQSGIQVNTPSWTTGSGTAAEQGFRANANGQTFLTSSQTVQLYFNDTSGAAGTHNYILWRFQGSTIGDIDTTDNSTIRYNTFTGGHWTQFEDGTQPDLLVGTVLSTIDDLLQWTQYEYTNEDGNVEKTDIAGHHTIGETKTIYIDEDGATAEGTALSHDTAKRIAKCKVSDVEGDRCVYGVFAGHYKDGDTSVESLGLGVIRIGSGVTVQRGDLLESAGDGTARPQTGDTADLFKAGTIAKVTSTTVVETYDDGSYTVPCTLHCG